VSPFATVPLDASAGLTEDSQDDRPGHY
jgi:hypothetical protein